MGLFSSPSAPYVAMPTRPKDPPQLIDKAVEDAATRTRQELMAASGFTSGIKTGGQGVVQAPDLSRKTLMGM